MTDNGVSSSQESAPSADEKTLVLTGATSGIGRIATRELAEDGWTIAAVGRDRSRGEALESETEDRPGSVQFHRADLASQSTVRQLAEEIRRSYDRLDVLAHNAGVAMKHREETEDGIEYTFAVNHLAPYLLTHELHDLLLDSRPSRVVVTSSGLHRRATLDFENLQFENGYDSLDAYARTKLENVAFTLELAERLPEEVTANCFHPGFVPSTNLFRNARLRTRITMRIFSLLPGVGVSRQEGASRLVKLIRDPEFAVRNGTYLGSSGVESPALEAQDQQKRARLWEESATLTGVDPDWP